MSHYLAKEQCVVCERKFIPGYEGTMASLYCPSCLNEDYPGPLLDVYGHRFDSYGDE